MGKHFEVVQATCIIMKGLAGMADVGQ